MGPRGYRLRAYVSGGQGAWLRVRGSGACQGQPAPPDQAPWTVQPETGSRNHSKGSRVVRIPESWSGVHGKCSRIVKIPEPRHPPPAAFSPAAPFIYISTCEKI